MWQITELELSNFKNWKLCRPFSRHLLDHRLTALLNLYCLQMIQHIVPFRNKREAKRLKDQISEYTANYKINVCMHERRSPAGLSTPITPYLQQGETISANQMWAEFISTLTSNDNISCLALNAVLLRASTKFLSHLLTKQFLQSTQIIKDELIMAC